MRFAKLLDPCTGEEFPTWAQSMRIKPVVSKNREGDKIIFLFFFSGLVLRMKKLL